MFSRTATRLTAWAALIAVLFVVLLPATLNAAGKAVGAAQMSAICTLEGAQHSAPEAPPRQPGEIAHNHCMFCTSSVPIFADANAPRLIAVLDAIPVVLHARPAESLPPDVAAIQPLSPRAPPRLN